MSLAATGHLLWSMVRVAARENWSRERLAAHQATALQDLRRNAYERSRFYRDLHSGLEEAPLHELPIVTKRQLMAAYDEVVTDPRITHDRLRDHVASERNVELFDDEYTVCATSGTSGTPGIFPYSEYEWAWILASFARASRWAGTHVRIFNPMRLAIVGSDKLSHQSCVVADSFDSPWVPALRLTATEPIDVISAKLTDWKPEMLVAYSALAGVLADEQLSGRLDISPRIVMCVAEALQRSTRARIKDAWGAEPFENYAATEVGVAAAECTAHQGLHIFEDLTIVEFVDDEGNAVPPGTMSARTLITPLYATTFPLIRYELDDTATYTHEPCSCGLPFNRITRIGGRVAETLRIRARDGTVALLHVIDFDEMLAVSDVKAWQVVCHKDHLEVLLLSPVSASLVKEVESRMSELISQKGLAEFSCSVRVVDQIPRLKSGKIALVRDAR